MLEQEHTRRSRGASRRYGVTDDRRRRTVRRRTLKPGIHSNIPMKDYVRDTISPEPSLSTNVVFDIVERGPLHAWQNHPRLGNRSGNFDDASARADLGSAVHSVVLGGPKVVYAPAKYKNWIKTDARRFRDEARHAGHIPLLHEQRDQVRAAAAAAKAALRRFGSGFAEKTMLWEDQSVWCRARADYLTRDGNYDIDIKTCANADPARWIRGTMMQYGYDVQAALRQRGHAMFGKTRDVLFLLVEIEPPYATSVVGIGPKLIDLANQKIDYAIKRWRNCLNKNEWPGYDEKIHYAEPPAWMQYDMADRGILGESG